MITIVFLVIFTCIMHIYGKHTTALIKIKNALLQFRCYNVYLYRTAIMLKNCG